MQTAAQLVSNLPPTATAISGNTSTTSPPDALPPKLISRLFQKFALMFGNSWTSQIPTQQHADALMAEWSRSLAGIAPEQIKAALDRLDTEYPPSLPAFRKLCRDDWQHRQSAYQSFPKGLPAPKADKSAAAQALAEMRGKIAANTKPKTRSAEPVIDAGDMQSYRLLKQLGKDGRPVYSGLYTPQDLQLLRDLPRFQRA